MEIAKIVFPLQETFTDYPDNESQAILVYFLGCNHYCVNCYNIELTNYDSDKGKEITIEELYKEILKKSQSLKTNKVVFSGGDPLYKKNLDFTRKFLNNYKDVFDICVYTGHPIEYVKNKEIKNFKFIKCGKYNGNLKTQSFKCDEYIQLASTDQEFYGGMYNKISRNGRYYFK